MIVRRIVEEKDGHVEVSLALTKEQATYIMNVGLASLLTAGAATLQDVTREQLQAELAEAQTEEGIPSPAANEEIDDDANPVTRH